MAQVSCDHVSAFPGYQWDRPGAVVEMGDGEAAMLMEIAGPDAGYAIIPPPKPPRSVKTPAPTEDDGKSGTEGKAS
jgi:hypothetical protein